MIKNKFGRALTIASFLVLLAAASGCSSGPDIRSAYDDRSDFSQYETYNFYSDAGQGSTSYQSLFSQYMVTAITLEMEDRGYVKSDDPDLLVNFNARFDDKTKVTTSPSMNTGGYYGYRGGHYGAWGGYGYGTETHVSQYTEGTFNIDLVDAKKETLVWEAVAVGRMTEKKRKNMQEGIRNGVPKFFAFYPFVAGDGTPRDTGK
jgi:hypothetical protein